MIANLQAHYGFTRMPFTSAVPVPALYASAAHKEAVARLRWLISARGLGVLTGEVGSGKTVALRAAADGLDASRHTLIYLPNPQIGVRGIHGALAMALGQGTGTSSSRWTNRTCSPASSWRRSGCSPTTTSIPDPR